MQPFYIFIWPCVISFLAGLIIGIVFVMKRKAVGTLVIDQTGEKDLWTVIFDEDLSDVENETSIVLSIRKKT